MHAAQAATRASDSLDLSLPDLAHVYRVAIPEGTSSEAVLADLNADAHVLYAQPAYAYDLDQASPPFDDAYLGSASSWGQPYADLWGLDRVRAPLVWDRAQGEGVVVAVVDTGLDRFHPDIADNVWVNPGEDLDGDGRVSPSDLNGLDDDGNGFIDDLTGFDFANSIDADEDGFYDGPDDVSDADPFDDVGHGTHVAGTIAAMADNGIGIVGVAPRARIMALKGFPERGSADDLLLWRAVLYAAENGAAVINNSWSCGRPCPENPLADDVLSLVEALGVVVVTSAGNASDDVVFRSPESQSSVITVGALGFDDRLPNFSNRGWLMDVVAPGGGPNDPSSIRVARRNILSLLSSGAGTNYRTFAVGEDYLRLSGTSMAAPHVAGAAALLLGLRPELEPREVRRLLRLSARDLGVAGHDAVFGAGLIDLPSLLEAESPDLVLAIEGPRAAAIHDPKQGVLELRGIARGADLESVAVSVGRGLAARDFVPIEEMGDSFVRLSPEGEVLAHWDVEQVADGPWILRVRARLFDGRTAEEHTVVGIERNRPVLLAPGANDVGKPVIARRRVVWQVDEATDSPQTHDLAAGRFPTATELGQGVEPESSLLFEREGDQRDVVSDGRHAVWTVFEDGQRKLEFCGLEGDPVACEPRRVSPAPGGYLDPRLHDGVLVWMRFDGGEEHLEGCRLEADGGGCTPNPLLALDAEPGWRLRSFDGQSLLIEKAGVLGRCPLGESIALSCHPRPITLTSTSIQPIDPIHDGPLIAFAELDIEPIYPSGCEPGVFSAECIPEFGVVWQNWACWLDDEDVCDPIPFSARVPQDRTWGYAVSGRRLVWSMADDLERPAVRVCEFDPETRRCAEQRLGGGPAFQTNPSIDRNRVVWEDRRSGVVAVWGIELPDLAPPDPISVRAGRPFAIWLRASRGFSADLAFELETLEGVRADSARVHVRSFGRRGRAVLLRGRFPHGSEGLTRWKLRATGEGGLYSEAIVEVDVEPARPWPRWWSRLPASLGSQVSAYLKPYLR